jgi:peptidyl-prolyl cis-trans isomerase C
MKNRAAIALLSMHLAVLAACGEDAGKQSRELQGGEIVRVGSSILTETDLENLLPEGEKIPFSPEEKKAFIDRWIETEILYQGAVRRGLAEDPRIQARLRSLEQEYLADHLVYLELRDKTRVTEEEVEEYFRAHEREYMYEYRVSHILVNTIDDAQRVRELLEKHSFSWVANRHSVDPVAKRGGDLGYLTKGNMIPEFETVIFDMKPNEVSDVVKSDFGYHFIKLVGMREALVKVDLADVRAQIMNALMIRKREHVYKEFIEELQSTADIEYYDPSYSPGGIASPADTLGKQP